MLDIQSLIKLAIEKIQEFSAENSEQTFYAFAIDAGMLCFNSNEGFAESLQRYQKDFEGYEDPDKIESLKYNTGDWSFQGFYELSDDFEELEDVYEEHYDMSDDEQQTSEYQTLMTQLLEGLNDAQVFNALKTTDDFRTFLAGHKY